MDRRAFLRSTALLPAAGALGCGATDVLHSADSLRVAVSWSAFELEAFRRVLARLPSLDGGPPRYRVDLLPLGDDIEAALSAKGSGRPDIVLLPRPGLVGDNIDALHPIPRGIWDPAAASSPYAPFWRRLLVRPEDQRAYGLPFKGAVKSLVWYRKSVYSDPAELEDPLRWFTIALGAGDGWMLSDFFENVLYSVDASAYRDLLQPQGRRDWGHDAVRLTFDLLGRIWGRDDALAGGVGRALATQFPDAVRDVFRFERASMVVAPDFAEPFAREAPSNEVGVMQFPKLTAEGRVPHIAGGDIAVLTREPGPHTEDFLRRLTDPRAPRPWIDDFGGFVPVHRDTRPSSQSVPGLSTLTSTLHEGREAFEFDLSDEIGPIGGRNGLWRVLRDFLVQVGDGGVNRRGPYIAQALERLSGLEERHREARRR